MMLIESYYDGVELHREDKIIYAKFLLPHTVLSTCRVAGGMQKGLRYIYNHQGCEPTGHSHRFGSRVRLDPAAWRRMTCELYALPDEACATLGTAANMNNASFVYEKFGDLMVVAVCTGGVETNAGRAGDPASVHETAKGFETLPPAENLPGPGTINSMIFINQPLTPGAITRVIMTATEAKSAALQELGVNSRYSDGLATGTGTDQIAVAALEREGYALTSAGKHSKLGELIGKAVLRAVKETLSIQNRLTPSGQCSAKIHLERFGLTRQSMQELVCSYLTEEHSELFCNNFSVVEQDPLTVAAVAAMVHLKDKFTWGVLPAACWSEIMGSYGAQTACAVCGDYTLLATYRDKLSLRVSLRDNSSFVNLVCRAIAMGFTDKWGRSGLLQKGEMQKDETEQLKIESE